jgi:hypothetical protein
MKQITWMTVFGGALELYNNKGSLCRLPLYWGYALSLPKFTTRIDTQQAMIDLAGD